MRFFFLRVMAKNSRPDPDGASNPQGFNEIIPFGIPLDPRHVFLL